MLFTEFVRVVPNVVFMMSASIALSLCYDIEIIRTFNLFSVCEF